jgi:O-antigen ligase
MIGAIACLFVLVAAGARIPFLALLAALLIGLMWDRIGRIGVYAGTAGAVLLPVFVIGFSKIHARLLAAGDLPAFVDRVFTVLTISNRHIIWSGAFSGAFHNLPSAVFGNGVFGHITSGASRIYGYLFEVSWANPFLMGSHNSYIQILLDGGLLALFAFLALVGAVVWKLPGAARDLTGSSSETLAANRMERNLSIPLVYLFLTASTEVSISYLTPEVLYLLVALLLLITLGPGKRTLMQEVKESTN